MVFDLFSMLNRIIVVVIPYPGQKVYKYIYSAIPKRPLIWHYTVQVVGVFVFVIVNENPRTRTASARRVHATIH